MDQLKQEEVLLHDKLNEIYKRLKVLFGHPNNNEMLEQLQSDYDELHADNRKKFNEILQPHRMYLEDVFEETKTQLENQHRILPNFSEDKKIYELIEKLMLQITTKKTLLNAVVLEINELDKIPINDSLVEHIQNYFQSSNQEFGSGDSARSQLKAPSLATVTTEKSYNNLHHFVNILESTLNIANTKMEEYVEQKMIKALQDFKNMWDADIEYILSLYKVKYDNEIF